MLMKITSHYHIAITITMIMDEYHFVFFFSRISHTGSTHLATSAFSTNLITLDLPSAKISSMFIMFFVIHFIYFRVPLSTALFLSSNVILFVPW